ESDVGEEDVSCPRADSRESEGGKCGPVRTPVAGVDVLDAEANDEQDNRYLDDDDGRVKLRALLDADHQDRRDQKRDHERRQIEAHFNTKNLWRSQKIVGLLD